MALQFSGGLAAQLRKRRQPGGPVVSGPFGSITPQVPRPQPPLGSALGGALPATSPLPARGGALPLPPQQGAGIGFGGGLASQLAQRPQMGASNLPVPIQPQPSQMQPQEMALQAPTQPDPTGMSYGGRTPPRLNPRQIGKRSANQAFRRQQQMWGEYLKPALERLREQANTDRFSDTERAHYLAPQLDALRQQLQGAEGSLTRQLQERGLGTSSGMASGLGALAGAGAQARTGVIGDLFNREEDRQSRAQEMQLQISQALATGQQGLAAQLANQLRQLDLQEQAYRDSQEGGGLGDLFGGVLGGLGGLAGLAGSMGWNPFGSRRR
jgi:hypothetical protein